MITYQRISNNIFNCKTCLTRCDGTTVPQFDFERDVAFSEKIEREIMDVLNKKYSNLQFKKTIKEGYPDIEIYHKNNSKKCVGYIEVKGQARTFMSIERLLPDSNLKSSETLALNLSDLERYCQIKDSDKLPIFLVWCVMNRPCLVLRNSKKFYFQDIDLLKKIRDNVGDSRRFRRKSGQGDVIDGVHKGVVVNYHFSINELIYGLPRFEHFWK